MPLKSRPRVRGIYLLPNLFTMFALFAGFYAVVAAMQHLFQAAAVAVFVALVADGLDGRVARLTHTQSDFGAELDSLSDMVSFGVAPALILYSWSLHALGRAGWLVAFIYTMATALRLARFNVSSGLGVRKGYFQGLPTPAAAAMVASMIWATDHYHIKGESLAWPVAIVALLLATLKVSTIAFRSFKDVDLRGRVPFAAMLLLVLVVVLITFDPPEALFLVFVVYIVSGLIGSVIRRIARKKRHDNISAQKKKSQTNK